MPAEPIRVELPADLTTVSYRTLRHRVRGKVRRGIIVLDCAGVAGLDTLSAARLLRLIAEERRAGLDIRLANLSDDARETLDGIDSAILEERPSRPPRHPLEAIGARTYEALATASAIGGLVRDTGIGLTAPAGPRGIKWDRAVQQMALVGSAAVPIVVFISFLIGVVLALNGATQLRQFGASIFIANLVAISMTREMGPLITAIIVAGRTGSAIAAEIGAMVVAEEIDAMRAMALSPVRFLVVPKVLALMLMVPLLTVLSNVAGILGGYVVGVFGLDLGHDVYLSQTVQSLFVSDVLTGLIKSVVFGAIIGLVGAYRGLSVRGGPEAVGRTTTSAVVTGIILCIVTNAGFTAFFYFTS